MTTKSRFRLASRFAPAWRFWLPPQATPLLTGSLSLVSGWLGLRARWDGSPRPVEARQGYCLAMLYRFHFVQARTGQGRRGGTDADGRWPLHAGGGGWNGAKTERDRPGGGRWAHPASAPVGPFAPCCLWFSGPAPGSCPARGAAVPPPYWPRRSTQSGPRAIFSCCARQICATLLPPTTPTK